MKSFYEFATLIENQQFYDDLKNLSQKEIMGKYPALTAAGVEYSRAEAEKHNFDWDAQERERAATIAALKPQKSKYADKIRPDDDLRWAKERALALAERGKLREAMKSMLDSLRKSGRTGPEYAQLAQVILQVKDMLTEKNVVDFILDVM